MLSPEQLAAFNEKIQDAPQTQEPDAERVDQATLEPKADIKPDNKEPEGRIPYSRFKEVNDSKKKLEQRTAELEQELNKLRGVQNSASQQRSFIDELADLEQKAAPDSDLARRLEAIERQMIEREANAQLDNLISTAKQHYPDVPERYFYSAIAAGKEVEDAVELWEETKREVLGAAKPNRVAPAAPPIPSRVPPQAGQKKPQTLEEAHAAFKRFIRKQ